MVILLSMGSIGSSTAQTKLVFTPQWLPQAQFTGYYVALSKGFYKEAGLDVTIRHPSMSKPPIEYLTSGESQLITLFLATAMKEIDKGTKLVNVLQTSQQSGEVIISHTPLKGLQSLRGMKVGCWKTGFSEVPVSLDRRHNLGIQWVPFLSNINLYVSKAIDATLAMTYNEYILLQLAGQRIHKDQLLYMNDLGYNVPEDGLYVTADYYQRHKQAVDSFAQASRRGWEWAIAHPEEALDIVMLFISQNGNAGNIAIQERMMKECFRLMIDKTSGQRTYQLSPAAVELTNSLLRETGYLKNDILYQQIIAQ